ncbi:cytoplasmic dynein 2 intermediate chain 1 [Brachyistius frenatus]|uniref:cytoplasmic dynein 2 intermediate chain 1 n=1 Tax=Brachyistius frenatus TaxID=100188 RepID=UPI0037E82274
MHSDKKITKEDTWRPADLRRHIRAKEPTDVRRRGGESIERRYRDQEKEARREREKLRERERRDADKQDRYTERKKEGSQDRRGDKEKDRRDERDREKKRERDRLVDESKYGDDDRENRDRRRDREEKHERERDKERHRDREDRDRERRREERDREHRSERERRRHEVIEEGREEKVEKYYREKRDRHPERERHKNSRGDERNDKEIQERHGDRKHSEQREEKEYKEEHRKSKEERERRHKERGHHDEKRKNDSESRERRDSKEPGEEVRRHRGDRERADKERRHREEDEGERKHKERRHREEDEGERKHKERRHREEDEGERKHKERRHREEEKDAEKKHRDQRHKEEEDIVRNHQDRTHPKKSSSDKSQRPERTTVETEVVNEHLPDQEYEDDFEDYEEDFEEMDESANEGEDEKEPEVGEERQELTPQRRKEIEAIQRAMDEENERVVGTAQSRESVGREEEDGLKWSKASEKSQSRASQRGKFIDFVAAKKREVSKKVATKQQKRSTELLRLIDLDFSMTFSHLDLLPVNEYDMYIRSFGTANTKQAYVQWNEDNADRDIQTEEIETCETWTQHPPEHNGACGDANLPQEARNKTMSELNFDSQRLTSFLRSASQVMVVLLEEDQAERKSLRKLETQTDALSFSDGSLQLNTKLSFLYGRQVSLVHFSRVQRHTMMSVHMATTEPSAVRLDSCTMICIWNIWEPSRPQKILVYESEVQCCCFSPGKATLVFAGTSVGSVVLWDLREPASDHHRLKIGEDEWTFRQPTFSTDAVMAGSGHLSSVTSVEVVPSAVAGGLRAEVPLLASEEESSGLSFQLASLDESGVLNFWVVVELPKGNEAGSPTDLGLRPGGKVKLLHSSSLLTAERVSPRDAVKTRPLQTLILRFLPTDSNHFFIGTNMGLVNHGTSHGLKAPPKCYSFQEVGVRPVDVNSIHFSPFRQRLFLVGCGNGSIRLHAFSHEKPVAEWRDATGGEAVVSLQWAQTRPTVFCVLDAASNLHIWDLLKNDTQPVATERMNADRVTAMAVFGDSGQQNTYSGIALAHESGKIEMQYFKRNFTASCSGEEEKLESMMTEAF